MVDNVKEEPSLIFQDTDGKKYTVNPFATAEPQKRQEKNVNFACNLCNTTFRRQDHLKRHILSLHSTQKYSVCPVCEKDFKRKDILLTHIKKTHSTTREIFHCRECGVECKSLSDLEKHEDTHTLLTERHVCPHCSNSFKRRDHMVRHIKSQHLNQLVVCPICGQTYKRKDHVVRHVREKHKMGLLNGKLVTSTDML